MFTMKKQKKAVLSSEAREPARCIIMKFKGHCAVQYFCWRMTRTKRDVNRDTLSASFYIFVACVRDR